MCYIQVKKSVYYQLIIVILGCCLYISCAKQNSLTGGVKDETPPTVLGINPINNSTQFKSKTITIQFDEYVQITDAKNQVFISPLMAEFPEFKLKRKSLVVTFKEALQDSTTYTLHFGESIKDLNEGNELKNFVYAFSTGNQLDSLVAKGKVIDAKTGDGVADILVCLYTDQVGGDTLFTTTPPKYLTRTDADGRFEINHITMGTYQLIALQDQNANFFYDESTENIAFLAEPIVVNDDSIQQTYTLRLFNEENANIQIAQRKNEEYGHLELIFNQAQDSLQLYSLDSLLKTDSLLILQSPKNDSMTIWYSDAKMKKLSFAAQGSWYQDTLRYEDTILFTPLTKPSKRNPLTYQSNLIKGGKVPTVPFQKPLQLRFSHPILKVNTSKIYLWENNQRIQPMITIPSPDENSPYTLAIDYKWKANQNYQLLAPPYIIRDFFGRPNDTIDLSFVQYDPSKYGNLLLKVPAPKDSLDYFAELRDESDVLIHKVAITDTLITIPKLLPKTYQLIIVEDANRNGKWDTGSYADKRQPERIFKPTTAVTIRENWDMEVLFNYE